MSMRRSIYKWKQVSVSFRYGVVTVVIDWRRYAISGNLLTAFVTFFFLNFKLSHWQWFCLNTSRSKGAHPANLLHSRVFVTPRRAVYIFIWTGVLRASFFALAYSVPFKNVFKHMLCFKLQVAIVVISTSLDPPEITMQMPKRTEKFVELYCRLPQSGLLASLSYNLILVIICTFYAFKTRKLPDNYKESRYIAFCVDTTLVIWITFLPTYFTTSRATAKTTILVVSLLLNASVTMACLFIPRLYSLYRNLREISRNGHIYKDLKIVKHVVQRNRSHGNSLSIQEGDELRTFRTVPSAITISSDVIALSPEHSSVMMTQKHDTLSEYDNEDM